MASWFRMKPRCPTCGLLLDRHEGSDYYLGGMMLNIVLSELVYTAAMITWLLVTWPHPPWDLLEWVGVPAMAAAPFLLYPISKTVWLAFDLAFRPARPEDFELGTTR